MNPKFVAQFTSVPFASSFSMLHSAETILLFYVSIVKMNVLIYSYNVRRLGNDLKTWTKNDN